MSDDYEQVEVFIRHFDVVLKFPDGKELVFTPPKLAELIILLTKAGRIVTGLDKDPKARVH